MISAIIFDLDNTIEDFSPAEAIAEAYIAEKASQLAKCKPLDFLSAFTAAKKRHSHRPSPIDYSRRIWISEAAESLKISLDSEELEQEYWTVFKKEVKLYPGTLATLSALRKHGFRLALLTDSDGLPGLKDARINELKLDRSFDLTVTADKIGENKPSPKGFIYIAQEFKLHPSQIMMVGDHPEFDLQPAKKLGMTTVWTQERIMLDRTFPFVDYKIKSISELLPLVEALAHRKQ